MGCRKYFLPFLLLVSLSQVYSVPVTSTSTTESLIVVSTDGNKQEPNVSELPKVANKIPKVPKIYSMHVTTNVTNRYATTLVTSKVKNLDEKSHEATFAVVLPETAFISGFVMEIDGKSYQAYVKEKEEAKKIYDNAVSSGLAAAHVEANARDSNRFSVSVNIEPQSKATFYLTYEELLKRQHGAYDIVINLHPGQPIKDLKVEVQINETRNLTYVKAPSLRSGNEISKYDEKLDPKANIERFNDSSAKVTFEPDLERQKELGNNLGNKEDTGLSGQFIVQYDVERDPNGGEVLISDGYFIHFFAPSDLTPMEKHVIFVLDTSGSMSGTRIEQLKQAMKSILGQLQDNDSFNIIDFNSIVNVWNITNATIQYVDEGETYAHVYGEEEVPQKKTDQTLPGSFEVTDENIEQAEKVIDKLDAFGGTNIKSSLVVALDLLNNTKSERSGTKQPIIIFLTDGEATVGEFGGEAITSVTKRNEDKVPIFSLSFGDGADRDFLEKLSLKNQGFARHIYEGADASLQLEEFYRFVSSPLLANVNFKYVSTGVSKVTKTVFPIMFNGSEIIVAGVYDPSNDHPAAIIDEGESPFNASDKPIKIDDDGLSDPNFALNTTVIGLGSEGTINLIPKFETSLGSLEKHWAYLTLKQLLSERDAAEDKTQYTKKALEIALKYSFVTPVSSLVVVKPNDTKAESNLEDASKSQPALDSYAFASAQSPGSIQFLSADSSPAFGSAGGFAAQSLQEEADSSSYGLIDNRVFEAESDTEDRIIGASVWNKNTSVDNNHDLSALKQKLVWLDGLLNENETLSLPNGKYQLGMSANVDIKLDCPLSSNGTQASCTLLKDCPALYPKLTDVNVYLKYFCSLAEYAGICCPKVKEETV